MANQRSTARKKADPALEAMKEQAAAYEELKRKVASLEELKREADEFEELKRQAIAFEKLKKRINPYPDDVPYSAQLATLREKLEMLASNPNSDLNEIAQCINAITFFENQQIKKIAEMRKDAVTNPAILSDTQSILQTSSVRKKEKEALVITEPVRSGTKS
jgi:septum formation inhibitor MinC